MGVQPPLSVNNLTYHGVAFLRGWSMLYAYAVGESLQILIVNLKTF